MPISCKFPYFGFKPDMVLSSLFRSSVFSQLTADCKWVMIPHETYSVELGESGEYSPVY